MNNVYAPVVDRIRKDVQNGGKLGQVSALRLLDLLDAVTSEIIDVRQRLAKLEPKA